MRKLGIPEGSSKQVEIVNFQKGNFPRFCIVGIQDAEASTKIERQPFRFPHSDVTNIVLQAGGTELPWNGGYKLRYDDNLLEGPDYIQAYLNLLNVAGFSYSLHTSPYHVRQDHFKTDYALYAFDLTPDGN